MFSHVALHRHSYRLFGDPDVVAALAAHRRVRNGAAVSTCRDGGRERRRAWRGERAFPAGGGGHAEATAGGVGARRRRLVRLSRALLSRVAACAAGRGATRQLSLAAADRAWLGVPAERAAEIASCLGRADRARRNDPAVRWAWWIGLCAGIPAGIFRRVHGGFHLGILFGAVSSLRRGADRCSRGILPRDVRARGGLSCG